MRVAIIEPSGALLEMLRYTVSLSREHEVSCFLYPPEDLAPYDCVVIEPGPYNRWMPAIYDHVHRRHKHAIILTYYPECLKSGLPTIRKQVGIVGPLLLALEAIAEQVTPIPSLPIR